MLRTLRICTERTAIYYVSAQYPTVPFKAITISARAKDKATVQPISSYDSYEQAIAEYEIRQEKPIPMYFMGNEGEVWKSDSLENLLPLLFNSKYL